MPSTPDDTPTAAEKRAAELLVDRATEGLDAEGEREIEALLAQLPDLDGDAFELAAAAVELAFTDADEPLPEHLRRRLTARAAEHFVGVAGSEARPRLAQVARFPARPDAEARRPATGLPAWLGWAAAAACLALAVFGWLPGRQPQDDPGSARAELIARAGDLLRLEWTATDDPAAASATGDVVWSNTAQAGFMRFRGLERNDPGLFQYQLWIFDREQNERYPVDGGVFDVAASGEVIVPIDAKIRIVEPTLFAVTVEKPGGVVVSSRERLPLVAKVG